MLMFGGSVIFLILVLFIVFILTSCIRIVPQAQALVVERLGAYLGTYGVGIHFMVPFIDRVAKKVNLKEQVEDFPPQPVITKDNVPCRSILWYFSILQIRNPMHTVWNVLFLRLKT